MSDERILPFIYGLCILLWIGSSQITDPRMRRMARQGAWVLFGVGMVVAIVQLLAWLAR